MKRNAPLFFCPKHPKQRLRYSGRVDDYAPVRRCPICVEAARVIVEALRGNKLWKTDRVKRKQCVLPAVMMSERWP